MSYFDWDPREEDPATWINEPVRDYDGPSWDPEDDGYQWDEDLQEYVKIED